MVDKVLGAKVRIDVKEEGSYEGFVHNVDEKSTKLTLVQVIVLEEKTKAKDKAPVAAENKPKEKVDDFARKLPNKPNEAEIGNKNDKIHDSWNPEKSKVSSNKPLIKWQRKFAHKYLQKAKPVRRDPSDDGPSLLQRKPTKPSSYYSEDLIDSPDYRENFTINPPNVVVIDSFGEMFEEAVAYISRQRVVGLAWEGVKVGRFGKLCLIQIGCNKCIYIFDIVTLGDSAFDKGLADIMDSGDILKVIHNCRHLSDALYHQYGVSLVNVFDTQVADVIIYRSEMDGDLPRQTSSLISSLYEYLDLSPDEYHFYKTRLKHTTNDELVWEKRPMAADLIDAAAKTVMYLRELRLVQMERMMEEFIFGVDIYLSCIRDASDEVVKKKYSSNTLPEMFNKLHKARDRPRYRQLDPELEENNDREDPRQAWQDGHNFLEKYEKLGMRVREHKYSPLENKQFDLTPLNDTTLSDLSSSASKLNISEESPRHSVKTLRYRPKPVAHGSRNIGGWPANEGIFSHDDFPQLSSDSDSSASSISSPAIDYMTARGQIPNTSSRRLGRGRASALARNAELPEARLPGPTYPQWPRTVGNTGQPGRLQFPTDDELLTVPEVLPASRVGSLSGGTRVRVSRQ